MTGCEDSNATNNPESVTTNGQSESQTGEKPLDSSEKSLFTNCSFDISKLKIATG